MKKERKFATSLLAGILSLSALQGAPPAISHLRLHTDAGEAQVRPHESLVVQLMAYGRLEVGGSLETVRLQPEGAHFRVVTPSGGWVSKPFKYQGTESQPFYEDENSSLGRIFLRRATQDFLRQDSVLYTAPGRAGSYEIEATHDGKTASIRVEVSNRAPSRRKAETTTFARERPGRDPYRRLAEHYAPFLAQETWFHPKYDYPTRFDFDGDWKGDNNWESADTGTSQAYVYYTVTESETHWFLIYNFFHPRDYSDKCVAGTCHENDNEGLILTVAKDRSQFGRLQVMETLAHNHIYSYVADRRIKNGIHGIDGGIEFHAGSHPVVFVESGGHGVYGSTDNHSSYSLPRDQFETGTGITLVFKGRAERPKSANDRLIGYELLPIYEHWWLRAHGEMHDGNPTFDSYYAYEPHGDRPPAPHSNIAGSFRGRTKGVNKAKPFWGWHDERGRKSRVVATGQWGLDPAYSVTQNLRMPQPFSLQYRHNPYLGSSGNSVARVPGNARETDESLSTDTLTLNSGPPVADQGDVHQIEMRNVAFDPNETEGVCELKLRVDADVRIYLHRDQIWYQTVSGRPPSDQGSSFQQPIPRAVFRDFRVEKKDGRGSVRLEESPTGKNNYTAVLRVQDPKSGHDLYQIRVRWRWESLVPEPEPVAEQRPVEMPAVLLGSRLNQGRLPEQKGNPSKQGFLEFKGKIDGSVIIRIRGYDIFGEVIRGRPIQVEQLSLSVPLPSTGSFRRFELEQKDGRGEVVLLERPWQGNDYVAVIRISDPKGGSDRYRFRVSWEQ